MNIVWVVPGGVDRTGQDRVVPVWLPLIERLAQKHHLLIIALGQYDAFCHYELLGAHVINLGAARAPVNELRLPERWRQMHRALQVDGRRPDVMHAFHAGECGVLAGLMSKSLQLPLVTSIFSGELVWLPAIRYGWQGNWRSRLPVSLSLRLADWVTAGSHYALAPIKKRQKRWLPLGIEPSLFKTAVSRANGPPWRLMHVAHINPVKDQMTLLGALRRVSDQLSVRLDWFGEDTLNGRLQSQIEALKLTEVVHYHGLQRLADMVPYYQQAHLFLQSSRHESQGVAVLEAAAAGVPTVGTAVGLVAELSPESATAVAVGDEVALAEAMLTLLQNEEQRLAKGQMAQEWAVRYDVDWTAVQLEQLYQQLLLS